MSYKTKFLEIATLELDDTKVYYDYQLKGLGKRFLNSVKKSIKLIEKHPQAWHPLTTRTRRCLIRDFPYGIIYQIKEDHILIIAIASLHRKPYYWKDRIT